MSTIHKIADTPPQFPCWLWHIDRVSEQFDEWEHHETKPEESMNHFTHWTHSDTRPTVVPEERPTVVPEQEVPTTPSPEKPSAQMEKLAEEIASVTDAAIRDQIGDYGLIGFSGHISAILARAFAEKDAELATLREDRDFWDKKAGEQHARAEKAEAELARLKSENESLRTLWTEARDVVTQGRNANCVASYGKVQCDAVAAANTWLDKMPTSEQRTIDDASNAEWQLQRVIAERDQLKARAEKAEAELGSLHGRIGLFAANWYLINDNLPTDETFKQMEVEIVDAANKYMALMAERDQLRQEAQGLREQVATLERKLADEEKAASDVIAERDEAERILDAITSDILGEPIDWEFHDAKWAEAADLASEFRHDVADLRAQLAAAQEDSKRLRDALAREYKTVAPVVADFPVQLFEHLGEGYCKGRWAEDGSPYQFKVPEQLVPAFFALQRLARACADAARAQNGKEGP